MSDYVYYNANPNGTDTSDCVIRAISLAFHVSYSYVHRKLLNLQRKSKQFTYKNYHVYEILINELGGDTKEVVDSSINMSLDNFCDYHNSGTYLVRTCGKNITRGAKHLVCVINGVVYDSWDSRDRQVLSYYCISSKTHVKDQSKSMLLDAKPLIKSDIQSMFYRISSKLRLKHGIDTTPIKITIIENSDYSVSAYVTFYACDVTYLLQKAVSFSVLYVIPPYSTWEDLDNIIKYTTQNSFYNKLYYGIQKFQKSAEQTELLYSTKEIH